MPGLEPTGPRNLTKGSRRQVSRQAQAVAKQVVDEVRLAALRADGAMALAEHIMGGAVDLDDYRRRLARGDDGLNLLLVDIEATAIAQCKRVQRDLYDPWQV